MLIGIALIIGALLSGLAHRSFLSLAAVFVVLGFLAGRSGLEFIIIDPHSEFIHVLATLALIVILFSDGLEVDKGLLVKHWRLPARKLFLAMPLTCLFVTVSCYFLTNLTWLESALVGALLSPTDPVLTSAIISNKKVPERIRHSLNLESGLNDGLALPAVITLIAALALDSGFAWWQFLLQDLLLGIGVGLAVAFVAVRIFPSTIKNLEGHNKSLLALGVVATTYGLASAVHGNGLIAVFVGSVLFGIYRRDVSEAFEHMARDIIELVKLAIFLFFGASLSLHILTGEGIGALLLVIVALVAARPLAILLSLVKTDLTFQDKLFMGWFGPKGIATIAFSLLVLANQNIQRGEEIFHIAALAVVISIFAHGLSDSYGANWISKRNQAEDEHGQRSDAVDTIPQ